MRPASAACCPSLSVPPRRQTPDAITHFPAFDGNGNVTALVAADGNGLSAVYEYDPFGKTHRVTATVRLGSDGSQITLGTATYDLAGHPVTQTDAAGQVTTFAESHDAAGRVTHTTTQPNGGTRIETHNLDGTLERLTGTAVHGVRYVHGIDGNSPSTQTIPLLANGTDSAEWTKSYTDYLGRNYQTVTADNSTTTSYYNALGQLAKQVDPDGVTTLYAYNALGELEYTAVNLDQNGVMDLAGTDRVTRTVRSVGASSRWTGVNVRRTEKLGLEHRRPGHPHPRQRQRNLRGRPPFPAGQLRSHQHQPARLSRGRPVPYHQHRPRRHLHRHRPTGRPRHLRHPLFPQRPDPLRHHLHLRRPRSPLLRHRRPHRHHRVHLRLRRPCPLHHHPRPGERRRPACSVRRLAGRPSNHHHPLRHSQPPLENHSARRHQCHQHLPCHRRTPAHLRFPHLPRGIHLRPRRPHEDHENRRTFASDTGAALTTWNYSAQRGFLLSKQYADSQGPTYTYTAAGRLATRTWARGITTYYAYNPAGDLASVNYDDNLTPGVTHTYDRRGRRLTRCR